MALRPSGINLKLFFHPTRRMLMLKLSPSFNEAASVLAGPGITELLKGPRAVTRHAGDGEHER
jgi:hypothetical protein